MILKNKMLRRGFAALGFCSSLGAAVLGCGREEGPRGVRERSPATPSVEAGPEPAALPPGEPAPADPEAVRVLAPVSAPQLLSRIRSSRRRATLVGAWASWCGPCRRELPMLQALAENLRAQGVEVVLVSVDDPKDEDKARSFLSDHQIALQSFLVSGSVADFKLGINPRWPGMLPASFLFDANAQLVHFWGGEAFEEEIVPVVEDFLAGRPIQAETRYGLAPGKTER